MGTLSDDSIDGEIMILLIIFFIALIVVDGFISRYAVRYGAIELNPIYKKFGYIIPKIVFGGITISLSLLANSIVPLIIVGALGIGALIWNIIQIRKSKNWIRN